MIKLKTIIVFILIFFTFTQCEKAFAEHYYATYGTLNNCVNEPNTCLRATSKARACELYGQLHSSVSSVPPSYLPYLVGSSGENCVTQSGSNRANLEIVLTDLEYCPYTDDLGNCLLEPFTCSDGFPPDLFGYIGCDRPDLKNCPDGSPALPDSMCPITVCMTYQQCEDLAWSNRTCTDDQVFIFEYSSPSQYGYTCEDIDLASADHPDNGGNADGNTYNDPYSPAPTDPIDNTTDISQIGDTIGENLNPALSSIEQAVRELTEDINTNSTAEQTGLETINTSVNGLGTDLSGINDTITQGNSTNSTQLSGIQQSLDTIANNTGSTPEAGQCDPTALNYLACLSDRPLTSLTFSQTNDLLYQELSTSGMVGAFSSITNLFTFPANPQCELFTLELPAPMSTTISTDVHCTIGNSIAPTLTTVMYAFWAIVGFRIIASA